MKQEIFIFSGVCIRRIALVIDGRLDELVIESKTCPSMVEGIYLGKVVKVMPSINAAFVDCGLGSATFLSLKGLRPKARNTQGFSISDSVTEGAKVLVQVKSDERSGKGARVSREVSLVGRYAVLNPFTGVVSVSNRILKPAERARLNLLANDHKAGDEGIIKRTAAEGKKLETLLADILELRAAWRKIIELYTSRVNIGLIWRAQTGIQKFLRDRLGSDIDAIVVDDGAMFSEVQKYCMQYVPEVIDRVTFQKPSGGGAELNDLEEQLDEIHSPEINLPSGGRLYFETTRSMTTIDVDTSVYTSRGSRFNVVFQTNLEAAIEVGRQLRLRNIGGLVVIDFIGMKHEKDKEKIFRALKGGFRADPSFVKVSNFSEFGTVELTRYRGGLPHVSVMSEECSQCGGAGRVESIAAVTDEIFAALAREIPFASGRDFSVVGACDTIGFIRKQCSEAISNVETTWAVNISLVSEPSMGLREFKVSPC